MADVVISNVKLVGLSSAVPKKGETNAGLNQFDKFDMAKLSKVTGIEERRIADASICTSDLCLKAAEVLINDLNWEKSDIDVLVFVTQTPDYILPATSSIIQHKLGLSNSCLTLDISSGCSGYINGVITIGKLLQNGNLKKGLLLVGDTISKICNKKDKSTYPLFGDAGTATAFEWDDTAPNMYANIFSDGSGFEAIIVRDGGYRHPFSSTSLEECSVDNGINRSKKDLMLCGMDVFTFGISRAPQCINSLLENFKIEKDSIDFFIFHQANKLMNDTIRKKLKLQSCKVPTSLARFGNTSSASIPLTINVSLKTQLGINKVSNLILCGFGVGLSWGSIFLKSEGAIICDLIEM